MKKISLIVPLLFVACILLAQRSNPLRKLQIAEMAISQLYVDTVDQQKLAEEGIRGMLKSLDPHSTYTTAKETKAMNEPLEGSFDGIGVQFNMVEDTLLIIPSTLQVSICVVIFTQWPEPRLSRYTELLVFTMPMTFAMTLLVPQGEPPRLV